MDTNAAGRRAGGQLGGLREHVSWCPPGEGVARCFTLKAAFPGRLQDLSWPRLCATPQEAPVRLGLISSLPG